MCKLILKIVFKLEKHVRQFFENMLFKKKKFKVFSIIFCRIFWITIRNTGNTFVIFFTMDSTFMFLLNSIKLMKPVSTAVEYVKITLWVTTSASLLILLSKIFRLLKNFQAVFLGIIPEHYQECIINVIYFCFLYCFWGGLSFEKYTLN